MKTHSGEKPKKCNQCDFASSWEGNLRTHLKMHSGEKSNKCTLKLLTPHSDQCIAGKCSEKPSSFPNQPRLDKHKTCHASEKCTECGQIFGAMRNLRRHEKKKHQKEQVDLSVNSNHSDGDRNENAIPDALGDALNVDMIIVTK